MTERWLRFPKWSTYALAGVTVISDVAYLVYLRHHPLSRPWSGINAELLGLLMLTWSVTTAARGMRWGSAVIAAVGLLNMAVGIRFFL